MGKKGKKRAVNYNDFQAAFKQAERGTKEWLKRCQADWARFKDNDLLLLARFNELKKIATAQAEKQKDSRLKRQNPFKKWRTRAKKKPKVEISDPSPSVPQPVELEEPAEPLKPVQPAEATIAAETDEVKPKIPLCE